MKRIVIFVLLIAMAVGLTACAYEYKVSSSVTLQVDPLWKKITYGEDQYEYSVQGQEIWITYPNGGNYIYDIETGRSNWRGELDIQRQYLSGPVLVSALTEEALEGKDMLIVIVSILFAILSLWHLLLPRRTIFMLAYGWNHWKTEATPRTINGIRILGGIMLLAALFTIAIA